MGAFAAPLAFREKKKTNQRIFENQLLFLNFVSVLVPLKGEKRFETTATRQGFSGTFSV